MSLKPWSITPGEKQLTKRAGSAFIIAQASVGSDWFPIFWFSWLSGQGNSFTTRHPRMAWEGHFSRGQLRKQSGSKRKQWLPYFWSLLPLAGCRHTGNFWVPWACFTQDWELHWADLAYLGKPSHTPNTHTLKCVFRHLCYLFCAKPLNSTSARDNRSGEKWRNGILRKSNSSGFPDSLKFFPVFFSFLNRKNLEYFGSPLVLGKEIH